VHQVGFICKIIQGCRSTEHKIKQNEDLRLSITIISHGIILLYSPIFLSKEIRSPRKPLLMISGRNRNLPKHHSILFNNTATNIDARPTHTPHILSRPLDIFQVSHLADLTRTLIDALRSHRPENKSTFANVGC
jgi:hypothetical protein